MKKKWFIRILGSLLSAMVLCAFVVSIALAAPGLVTNLVANPSNTSMILTWTVATDSTSTVVRYSTTAYPATPASGTSAYSGTGFQCTVSSLTAGQVYYFAAWGYDDSDYSTSPATLVMSTLAINLPSGDVDEAGIDPLPIPTLPADINQDPDASGLNLEPFTSMITWFNGATEGGLGMPVNNAWQWVVTFGLVGAGIGTYLKIKQFFVAFAVLLILTIFAVGLDLVQPWLVAVEIVIGAGVWSIDKYMQ